MKSKKSRAGDMILKLARNTDELPTQLLVQSLNGTIQILARRGIKIRDWDDREKVVHSIKCLGSSVFLLAPREAPGTEGDADGKTRKPGGKRTPNIEKIPTEVLQNQEAAGNTAGQASEIASGIPGR